jgi:hypothetical protein
MKVEELFAMMLRVLRVARIALAYESSAGLYASDKNPPAGKVTYYKNVIFTWG